MIGNQNIEIFQPQEVLKVDYKISSIDQEGQQVYVGDMQGNVYRYRLEEEVGIRLKLVKKYDRLTRQKIDEIKCVFESILVLSDNQLFQLNSNLERSEDLMNQKEKVQQFCLNESSTSIGELIVITKKETLILFKYDFKKRVFVQQQQYYVPDIPVKIAWYEKSLFTAFADKEYNLMYSDEPTRVEKLEIPICKNPLIKVLGPQMILLLSQNNTGVAVLPDGKKAERSTYTFQQNKQLIQLSVSNSYLVCLYENMIQVFTISTQPKVLQEFGVIGGKVLSSTPDRLYYCTLSQIYYMQPTPYDNQIQQCLQNIRVNEAFAIFEQNSQYWGEAERQQKHEKLRMDVAWEYFKRGLFKEAEQNLMEIQYDIREFLVLFPELIPQNKKQQLIEKQINLQNAKLLLADYLTMEAAQKQQKKDIHNETKYLIQQGKEFMVRLLQSKRVQYINNNEEEQKDQLVFVASSNNPNKQLKLVSVCGEELLELIDYSLLKLCLELRRDDITKKILSGQIYCRSSLYELELSVQELRDQSGQVILAKYMEQNGKVKEALDIWQNIGKCTDSKLVEEACEETIRILKDQRDKKVIQQYLRWVLPRNQSIGMKLFMDVPDNVLDPHQMLSYFSEFDNNQNLGPLLKEKYLEILVLQKRVNDEGLHTQLALYYIDILFRLKSKDSNDPNVNQNDINFQRIKQYMKKLNDYLRNPQALYNGEHALERIKDSWLITDEIYLYGKTKRHSEALNKMVRNREFMLAEQYCAEKTDGLLTDLFKKYIQMYTDVMDSLLKKNSGDQKRIEFRNFIYKTINDFLKKYAIHSQFNPVAALEMLPDEWILNESDNSVYSFLFSVISNILHKKRNMKTGKNTSELDLLQAEYNLVCAKKAYVRITPERNCAKCHRKIADKVFAVYPDGTTIHSTCVASYNQNLSKKNLSNTNSSFYTKY